MPLDNRLTDVIAWEDCRSRTRRTKPVPPFPEARREQVEKGKEDLVDALASAVESKAGIRPGDDVAEFLAGVVRIPVPPAGGTNRNRDIAFCQ
jgi:hypothetical protein